MSFIDTTLPTHRPPLTEADMDRSMYGIRLSYLGEDGNSVFALGHVDKLRFLAAVNALLRADGSDTLDVIFDGLSDALDAVRYMWVFNRPVCKWQDGCPHKPGWCIAWQGGDESWCLYMRDDVTPETPGAFRITRLELW